MCERHPCGMQALFSVMLVDESGESCTVPAMGAEQRGRILANTVRELLSEFERDPQGMGPGIRRKSAELRHALEIWEGTRQPGLVRTLSGFRRKVAVE